MEENKVIVADLGYRFEAHICKYERERIDRR